MIAALFVEKNGVYSGLSGVDVWDIDRDARKYNGPWPVVAHPPCSRWGRFAKVNYVRWGGEHNKPGNDGGCFASAIHSVRQFGGVLEHPASSDAWVHFGLVRPSGTGWVRASLSEWVCEVWQSAYGHLCRKRTWLFYCGFVAPPDLCWDRKLGTHQIGFHDQRGKEKNKPTISGKAAARTPPAFRDVLIEIARGAIPHAKNEIDQGRKI